MTPDCSLPWRGLPCLVWQRLSPPEFCSPSLSWRLCLLLPRVWPSDWVWPHHCSDHWRWNSAPWPSSPWLLRAQEFESASSQFPFGACFVHKSTASYFAAGCPGLAVPAASTSSCSLLKKVLAVQLARTVSFWLLV